MITFAYQSQYSNEVKQADLEKLVVALSALESMQFTAEQVGVLQGIMSVYDEVDEVSTSMAELLMEKFQDLAVSRAITQIAIISEKYNEDQAMSDNIRDLINDSITRLKTDGQAPRFA